MAGYRIVETDNFGRDYPDESFVNLPTIYLEDDAKAIAEAINNALCNHPHSSRWYKVVDQDYVLQGPFEP
jgi:hypothetical protein